MGLLAKKQPVKLEEFCRRFYDRHIFGTDRITPGIDNAAILYETYWENIIEADPDFDKVSPDLFNALLTLLRIETFSLAWLHKFGIDSALEHSFYTQKYLHKTDRDAVWDAGDSFNQAVARSVTAGKTTKTPMGRAAIGSITKLRFDTAKQVMEKFQTAGIDPEKMSDRQSQSIGRPINRLKTEKPWRKDITPNFLMLQVIALTGYEFNDEARFRLTAMIHGFYNGALEAIEDIKLVK